MRLFTAITGEKNNKELTTGATNQVSSGSGVHPGLLE